MTRAEKVIREVGELNKLALELSRVGLRGKLHNRRPFTADPPPPSEKIYYDPRNVELARKLRRLMSSPPSA